LVHCSLFLVTWTSVVVTQEVANSELQSGNEHYQNGDFDNAIAAYRRAVSLDPSLHSAWTNLGNTLRVTGNIDESIVALEKSIEIFSDNPRSHYGLGISYYTAGSFDHAVKCFDSAVELDKTYLNAHYNKGIIFRCTAIVESLYDIFFWASLP
jgi:tetratricopeptide (TPR) repeat protein